MKQQARRIRFVPALVPIVALGAAAIWWLARGPRSISGDESAAAGGDPKGVLSEEKRRDPVAYVKTLAGREDAGTMNELIQVYSKWAQFPETLEARKVALTTMLAHPNVKVAMEAVLTAVDADQTRREQDPIWPFAVSSLGKTWDAVTYQMARDRMYVEERAKPKDLLLESLAQIQPDKLTDEQRNQLASDLIDLYPTMRPDQKPAVDKALVALAGSDVVEILAGRGMGENSNLKIVQERQRAIEAGRAIHIPPPPPDNDPPLPPLPKREN